MSTCPLCNRPRCRPEELSDEFQWCVGYGIGFRIDGRGVHLADPWLGVFGEKPKPIEERITFNPVIPAAVDAEC